MNFEQAKAAWLAARRRFFTFPNQKGGYARNAEGQQVSARDPHAVCWCSIGALFKEEPDLDGPSFPFRKVSELLVKDMTEYGSGKFGPDPKLGFFSFANFSDNSPMGEVKLFWDDYGRARNFLPA